MRLMVLSLCVLTVLAGIAGTGASGIHVGRPASRLRPLSSGVEEEAPDSLLVSMEEAKKMFDGALFRGKRAAGDSRVPVVRGNHTFLGDGNNWALITYIGSTRHIIMVLTYTLTNRLVTNTKFYRSTNYGASFFSILDQLDTSSGTSPFLAINLFHRGNMVIISHRTLPKFYYSFDQGNTWSTRSLAPNTLDPTSLLWNSVNARMALAHDPANDRLYVTQNLGYSWTMIGEHVGDSTDYQWGDPAYDVDASVVYFNQYDPNDANRGDFTVSLRSQQYPYSESSARVFDSNLGRHDDFLLLGPYIFVQKTDDSGAISLYVSYNRRPFQKAMISATDPHQNYVVSHIDEQQALVIVEHFSTQQNLYISDFTGVYFSLSLPDIVVDDDGGIDLELIEGVNGTLIANQYVRNGPRESSTDMRTLISLNNGGTWDLVHSPTPSCTPPQCSLHFHMTTSEYARLGVYSQDSAPGLILAHGNTGTALSENPDLYISRDGGVSWSQTLGASWGVTVVDHGGLLVAAKDYHHTPSSVLRYSCDEGQSWRNFTFSGSRVTVYGVITEPGEHTTTVSLYGIKSGESNWHVVTINFTSIFPSLCSAGDYYFWHPWAERANQRCILGSFVTIERRNTSACCLIGEEYTRPITFSICPCTEGDYECDYGYMRSSGTVGQCVRDNSVSLPPPSCLNGTYTASRGYRKVPGDVCQGGVSLFYEPVLRSCNTTNDPCHSHCVPGVSTCTPTSSSYTCQCHTGYRKNSSLPFAPCLDVNECSSAISPCSAFATCINTVGSFECACMPGYVGDGRHCFNINECLGSPPPCDSNATCTDTLGSFECSCLPGFSGDGLASGTGCSDVNECAVSSPCDENAQCTNTEGSYQCTCNQNFIGNGTICYNSRSPCENTCDASAECIYNSNTGYRCRCGCGMVGTGLPGACHLPADGCQTSSPCAKEAECSIAADKYTCQCKPGYSGDGLATGSGCINLNECDSEPCAEKALCYDTKGSFVCTCPPGYVGDGLKSAASGSDSVFDSASNSTSNSTSGCKPLKDGCTSPTATPAGGGITDASSGSKPKPVSHIALIIVCLVLMMALVALVILSITACKMYTKLKHFHVRTSQGVHYTNVAAEDDNLAWTPEDDQDATEDDEPLLK